MSFVFVSLHMLSFVVFLSFYAAAYGQNNFFSVFLPMHPQFGDKLRSKVSLCSVESVSVTSVCSFLGIIVPFWALITLLIGSNLDIDQKSSYILKGAGPLLCGGSHIERQTPDVNNNGRPSCKG